MLISTLKNKLSTVTGTSIGDVFFDWKKYLNIPKAKVYPCILWSLDNAKFKNDIRPVDIQNIKEYTFTLFAIALFRPSDDKITVWDTLETQLYVYLNKMNTNDSVVQIVNIDDPPHKIEGEYIPEGMISGDSEIGIMLTDIIVRTYC